MSCSKGSGCSHATLSSFAITHSWRVQMAPTAVAITTNIRCIYLQLKAEVYILFIRRHVTYYSSMPDIKSEVYIRMLIIWDHCMMTWATVWLGSNILGFLPQAPHDSLLEFWSVPDGTESGLQASLLTHTFSALPTNLFDQMSVAPSCIWKLYPWMNQTRRGPKFSFWYLSWFLLIFPWCHTRTQCVWGAW